jgi:hypothetical protein
MVSVAKSTCQPLEEELSQQCHVPTSSVRRQTHSYENCTEVDIEEGLQDVSNLLRLCMTEVDTPLSTAPAPAGNEVAVGMALYSHVMPCVHQVRSA